MKRPGGFGEGPRTRPASSESDSDESDARESEKAEASISLFGRFGRVAGNADTVDAEAAETDAAGTARLTDDVSTGPVEVSSAAQSNVPDLKSAKRERKRVEREEIKRFTAGARRRRTVWLVSVGSVVAIALASVISAYTPLMAVREIQIAGASAVSSDALVRDLQSQIGKPLPLVDQSAIKAALVKYPLIQSYTVESRPPSTLVVRLVERKPLGLLENDGGYALVDGAGVVIQTSAERIENYPVIEYKGKPKGAAFTSIVSVLRALPVEVRTQVETITATTADDVTLTLRGHGATVLWGSAEKSATKAVTLARLMKLYPPAGVEKYDVSSPENGVVDPR